MTFYRKSWYNLSPGEEHITAVGDIRFCFLAQREKYQAFKFPFMELELKVTCEVAWSDSICLYEEKAIFLVVKAMSSCVRHLRQAPHATAASLFTSTAALVTYNTITITTIKTLGSVMKCSVPSCTLGYYFPTICHAMVTIRGSPQCAMPQLLFVSYHNVLIRDTISTTWDQGFEVSIVFLSMHSSVILLLVPLLHFWKSANLHADRGCIGPEFTDCMNCRCFVRQCFAFRSQSLRSRI